MRRGERCADGALRTHEHAQSYGVNSEMMAQFESNSVSNLLARNFETIRLAYEVLDPDGAYDEFVEANEEILANTPEEDLKAWLDSLTMQIYCGSETRSRLESLQYAFLLTRYAERAAGENRFEIALLVLAEACYFSGFAEGMGMSVLRSKNRVNPSVSASHAAKMKHMKNSEPVKQFLLELLDKDSRPTKWNSVGAAVRSFEQKLSDFVNDKKILLDPYNLHIRVAEWCESDDDFKKRLGKYVDFSGEGVASRDGK